MNRSQEVEFTDFVRGHGDGLLQYARLLIPDAVEAEDLLQVALWRLSRRWGGGVEAPVGYVRVTLVNLAKDGARRRHLVPRPVDATGHEPTMSDPDVADAVAAQARLDTILAALPPRQRVAVIMRVVDGLSEAETANLLGCSPGTVKSNLSRGLDKLRVAFASALTAQQEGSA